MKICVFCSSSNAVADSFFEMASDLGNLLAAKHYTLVYGGANVGLMEKVAHTVKSKDGQIIGVIPQKIHDRELSSQYPDELIVTATMSERKKLMHEKSDAFIALPGGFGTLEEILEVITLKQLDYHRKPVVLINTNDFFNQLFQQFEHFYATGFAKENYRKLYRIVDTPEEAIDYIENYKHEDLGDKWFKVPQK